MERESAIIMSAHKTPSSLIAFMDNVSGDGIKARPMSSGIMSSVNTLNGLFYNSLKLFEIQSGGWVVILSCATNKTVN